MAEARRRNPVTKPLAHYTRAQIPAPRLLQRMAAVGGPQIQSSCKHEHETPGRMTTVVWRDEIKSCGKSQATRARRSSGVYGGLIRTNFVETLSSDESRCPASGSLAMWVRRQPHLFLVLRSALRLWV
ncbi:hypothetical protein S40288_10953 [Stachybotrys chartarum IBT 40288]|nr:hypothetical protein S40288_10953 [Stachybotrys chartarum IBT 40288]